MTKLLFIMMKKIKLLKITYLIIQKNKGKKMKNMIFSLIKKVIFQNFIIKLEIKLKT